MNQKIYSNTECEVYTDSSSIYSFEAWGQPPVSYYAFEVKDGLMYGSKKKIAEDESQISNFVDDIDHLSLSAELLAWDRASEYDFYALEEDTDE